MKESTKMNAPCRQMFRIPRHPEIEVGALVDEAPSPDLVEHEEIECRLGVGHDGHCSAYSHELGEWIAFPNRERP